jgi:hypothetical protein
MIIKICNNLCITLCYMDFNFINNNSSTLYIILNSHAFDENKYEFENYFKKLFLKKKKPSFLYLRDVYLCWYYHGIRGFSKNYKETIEKN